MSAAAESRGEEQLLLPFALETEPAPPRAASPRRAPPPRLAADAIAAACLRRYRGRRITHEYIEHDSVLVRSRTAPDGSVHLEVNAAYREAPPEVADAVVFLYAGRPRRADRRHLSHLIHAWHLAEAPAPPSVEVSRLVPGLHHDLRALLDQVIDEHFDDMAIDVGLAPRATRWVMARHQRRDPRSLILVNPLLDHPQVEAWYLRFLLFHECLHEVIPPRARSGRIERHPKEFRARERLHPDHARVREYELWLTGRAYGELLRDARRAAPRRRRRRAKA